MPKGYTRLVSSNHLRRERLVRLLEPSDRATPHVTLETKELATRTANNTVHFVQQRNVHMSICPTTPSSPRRALHGVSFIVLDIRITLVCSLFSVQSARGALQDHAVRRPDHLCATCEANNVDTEDIPAKSNVSSVLNCQASLAKTGEGCNPRQRSCTNCSPVKVHSTFPWSSTEAKNKNIAAHRS